MILVLIEYQETADSNDAVCGQVTLLFLVIRRHRYIYIYIKFQSHIVNLKPYT